MACVGALVLASLGACTSDDDSGGSDPAEDGSACPEFAVGIDAVVFVDPDGADDAATIEAEAAGLAGVDSVARSTPGEAWADVVAASGDTVDAGEVPEAFPSSLELVFDDEADWSVVRDELVGFDWYGGGYVRPGPEQAFELEAGRWNDADFVVFFEPEAETSEIEAVISDVEGQPDVASSRYLDQVAAYEEFRELFADSPELVSTVSPEILPSSLRVLTTDLDGTEIEGLAASYEDADSVREVVIAPSNLVVGSPGVADALTDC